MFRTIMLIGGSNKTRLRWMVGLALISFSLLIFFFNFTGLDGGGGDISVELSNSYFQQSRDIPFERYLVDNEKCRIPDLDAWGEDVIPFVSPGPSFSCRNQNYFNLTYSTNSTLVINEDVLSSYGYKLEDVDCCYRTVERINQRNDSYDKKADNKYEYSPDCYKMKDRATRPKSGFLKVFCTSSSWFGLLRYENFHLVAVLPEEENEDSTLSRKVGFWRVQKDYTRMSAFDKTNLSSVEKNWGMHQLFKERGQPPNVLVFGLDSTSRLNFKRFMRRTLRVMETDFEWIEIKGYTKVGENTFPNTVPLLTSFSAEELNKICYKDRWDPQDDCPYIWKLFGENNYLTALLEDEPDLAIFNYLKTGFVSSPVDFYIRPLMKAAYENLDVDFFWRDCLKYHRPEEMIINYMMDLVTLADSKGLPYFIYSWLTHLTHSKISRLQAVDKLLSETLQKLHMNGLLKNTMVLVMGDHGFRFGNYSATRTGWYEDKLPALWIRLPETLRQSKPSWVEALRYNSNQLVTPFNIYQAFKDVLSQFGTISDSDKNKNGSSLRGLSPFAKLPHRNCQEAGIPQVYCTCSAPVEYKSNLTFVKLAAEAVAIHVNSEIPSQCSKQSVKTITASTTFADDGVFNGADGGFNTKKEMSSLDQLPKALLISIITVPGHFHFNAFVNFNASAQKFSTVDVNRVDSISRPTGCLSTEELHFETLCYCRFMYI